MVERALRGVRGFRIPKIIAIDYDEEADALIWRKSVQLYTYV